MSIFERMKQGATEAARKVEQTVEITKMKSQISTREKEIDRLYARTGKAVYDAYARGDLSRSETEVIDYCEQLSDLHQDIRLIQEKITNIKLEKSCPDCGKAAPVNARFCPDCGKKFPEDDEKPAESIVGEIRVLCSVCGTENDIAARYCVECGNELAPADRSGSNNPPPADPLL
ncbi:zinc ribbon domain-containing protein [Paenibacillus darwinianus]|uniref:zinc ribbon domain-containing protein n=1 Tax=Paenibacillus darwinianus TaxID=1380763 RepID=UPI00068F015E|nr:zinc ribbon domain-containing protein [Paenibacillus darwinianus]